jgi:hypothetical protein
MDFKICFWQLLDGAQTGLRTLRKAYFTLLGRHLLQADTARLHFIRVIFYTGLQSFTAP